MLEVNDLNKRFGVVQAVKDLNFKVEQGEILGFLGTNGAGKTTTMRIITCFIPASSGGVKVDGLNIREADLEVRRRIGYLPESAPLYNDMIVTEYLNFAGQIRGLQGNKLSSRVEEMIGICGLGRMRRRLIGNLSKGYRQRVGLAQAMIHNPDLLILDEPMSGLDPNQIIEIRQLIKNIGREKTVIYCSHILPEVATTCSRIIIIHNGAIVASGTPHELTSKSSSGQRYILRAKGDKDALDRQLTAVDGVSKVSINDDGGGWYKVTAFMETEEERGDSIYRCAVENNWTLSELTRETASLEDVFTQLTRGV
ncbi:MAG: ATP-binding cassette domain-containing protein [Chitinivibrionales bacterium]|nr:ATP-binding cassette domain-containing protein [Chitinivibrionales bacterium]